MLATTLILMFAAASPEPAPSAPPAASSADVERAAELGLTREMIEKLDAGQLLEAIEIRERTRVKLAGQSADSGLVPILVPGFFFAAILGGIFLALWFRGRATRELHATLRQMIERGVSIPPELITPPQRKASDLRRGLILIGAGVGLCVFLLADAGAGPGRWTMGLIPLLIGLGYVAAWAIERRLNPAAPATTTETTTA